MISLFNRCPGCGGPVVITECRCSQCQLQMRGEFSPGQFSLLSEDQLTFIRVFLRARGNLSELERVLGISYPTIRNKLDEINSAFDALEKPHPASTPPSSALNPQEQVRRDILQKAADGQFTAEEALCKLQELKGGKK
jgi:hypothetical protein